MPQPQCAAPAIAPDDEGERQILVPLPDVTPPQALDKREAIVRAALTRPELLERVDGFPGHIIVTLFTVGAAQQAVEDLSPFGSILMRLPDKRPALTRGSALQDEARVP